MLLHLSVEELRAVVAAISSAWENGSVRREEFAFHLLKARAAIEGALVAANGDPAQSQPAEADDGADAHDDAPDGNGSRHAPREALQATT